MDQTFGKQIGGAVDIAQHTRVIHCHRHETVCMRPEQLPGAHIAPERQQLLPEVCGKAHGMPASAGIGRCGHGGATRECLRDGRDARGLHEGHVGQGDEPTVRVGTRPHAASQAVTQTAVGIAAGDQLNAELRQCRGDPAVSGTHHGVNRRARCEQMTRSSDAHRGTVRQRRRELVAPKAPARTRGEQQGGETTPGAVSIAAVSVEADLGVRHPNYALAAVQSACLPARLPESARPASRGPG